MIGLNASELMESLNEAFAWLQARGLRVGRVWLHKREIELLYTQQEHFDRESNPTILDALSEQGSARFVGYLWGAYVYESPMVPEGHIAMVPDDFDAKLIGSTACMPLVQVPAVTAAKGA